MDFYEDHSPEELRKELDRVWKDYTKLQWKLQDVQAHAEELRKGNATLRKQLIALRKKP